MTLRLAVIVSDNLILHALRAGCIKGYDPCGNRSKSARAGEGRYFICKF